MSNELTEKSYYEKLKTESKSLEARIEAIHIDQEKINTVAKKKIMKTIIKEGINAYIPFGKAATLALGWHEEMEEQIKKMKEEKLMEGFFLKTDEQLDMINRLTNFVTDPYGFTIFSKLRMILNETPPDSKLIDHLSTVLANIVLRENFESLFEITKFVLSQIEKLTPQSLTIIADKENWPKFTLNASTYFGGKISSEFHEQFAKVYVHEKGITDDITINRIIHSIRELQNANLLEGFKLNDNSKENECRLTSIGEEIYKYLK